MTDAKLYALVLEHYKLQQIIRSQKGEYTSEQKEQHNDLLFKIVQAPWYEVENCYKMAKLCNPNHIEA
jgi:hypothetical protein